MAHIKLAQIEEMTPELQEKAKEVIKNQGYLGETFRLLALREDIYNITMNMASSFLMEETELPHPTKERIALLVSLENGCKMCVNSHKKIAKNIGMTEAQIEQVMGGIEKIECEAEEKILLALCVRAAQKDLYKILKSDVDKVINAGYSESQVLEAVTITAYFNYTNTISNVFGLEEVT